MDNIILIATPENLARTQLLRFDTGDVVLDAEFIARKFMSVIVGYRRMRLVKIAA